MVRSISQFIYLYLFEVCMQQVQIYCCMNPEFQWEQLNEIVDTLSSNERYFYVYHKDGGYNMGDLTNMKPYVLVYENDDEKTVGELMKYFVNQMKKPQLNQVMMWQLFSGYKLKREMSIKDIKRQLRRDNINGLKVYTKLGDIYWTDQCAMKCLVEGQTAFNSGKLQIPFHLTEVDYIFYLPIMPNTQYGAVQDMLSTEIKRVFAMNVQSKNIKIFIDSKKELIQAKIGAIRNGSQNSSTQKFILKFESKITLKTPPRQNNSFVVIKGDGIEPKIFHYDEIKDKKVIDILKGLKDKANWHQFGLLITETVLKPFQKFDKIQFLCKNSSKHTKHLTANIIKQSHIFELEQEKIIKKGLVDFEKIVIDSEINLKHRKECEDKMRDRAQNAKDKWFKNNFNNVKPLLLYTSQLYVKSSSGTKGSIYRTMNTFLRQQQFGKIGQKDYQNWQYRFASELLHQLTKIKSTQYKQLWRGVSYLPKHEQKQQILFKQFNSSSTSKTQAQKFAQKALYKITKAKSCHPIKEYSYYQSQDEVLFEPYLTLKITKVYKELNPYKTDQDNKPIQITVYEAQQIEKTKPPQDKSLFILWVDDKTNEGRVMWQKLEEIQKTTVMIQLLSTEQLLKWMAQNKAIINDPTVEIVMITNMTRVEKGVKVEKAGVYAIEAFKKYKPNSHIFVYIGWVEGTLAKLKEHNHQLSDKLQVSKSEVQIRKFLNDIGVK